MFLNIYLLFLFRLLLVASKRDVEKGCWPSKVVPYRIEKNFSKEQKQYIQKQVDKLNRLTCVRWMDLDDTHINVSDYALFVKTSGRRCSVDGNTSDTGYVVNITLTDVCFEIPSAVIHEMLHVMGFENEHQRSDRDCYVHVHKNKVKSVGSTATYEIIPQEAWVERFPYDKRSVMHYRRDMRLKALSERWYEFEPLGNLRGELTELDVWKIKYKFCGYPHFCDSWPWICEVLEQAEKPCTHKPTKKKQ